MTSRAFERGAARGRYCRRLWERRGIVVGAINPYRTAATASAWALGFHSTYYGGRA